MKAGGCLAILRAGQGVMLESGLLEDSCDKQTVLTSLHGLLMTASPREMH